MGVKALVLQVRWVDWLSLRSGKGGNTAGLAISVGAGREKFMASKS